MGRGKHAASPESSIESNENDSAVALAVGESRSEFLEFRRSLYRQSRRYVEAASDDWQCVARSEIITDPLGLHSELHQAPSQSRGEGLSSIKEGSATKNGYKNAPRNGIKNVSKGVGGANGVSDVRNGVGGRGGASGGLDGVALLTELPADYESMDVAERVVVDRYPTALNDRWKGSLGPFWVLLCETYGSEAFSKIIPGWALGGGGWSLWITIFLLSFCLCAPLQALELILGQAFQGNAPRIFPLLHLKQAGFTVIVFISLVFEIPRILLALGVSILYLLRSFATPLPWVMGQERIAQCLASADEIHCAALGYCRYLKGICLHSPYLFADRYFQDVILRYSQPDLLLSQTAEQLTSSGSDTDQSLISTITSGLSGSSSTGSSGSGTSEARFRVRLHLMGAMMAAGACVLLMSFRMRRHWLEFVSFLSFALGLLLLFLMLPIVLVADGATEMLRDSVTHMGFLHFLWWQPRGLLSLLSLALQTTSSMTGVFFFIGSGVSISSRNSRIIPFVVAAVTSVFATLQCVVLLALNGDSRRRYVANLRSYDVPESYIRDNLPELKVMATMPTYGPQSAVISSFARENLLYVLYPEGLAHFFGASGWSLLYFTSHALREAVRLALRLAAGYQIVANLYISPAFLAPPWIAKLSNLLTFRSGAAGAAETFPARPAASPAIADAMPAMKVLLLFSLLALAFGLSLIGRDSAYGVAVALNTVVYHFIRPLSLGIFLLMFTLLSARSWDRPRVLATALPIALLSLAGFIAIFAPPLLPDSYPYTFPKQYKSLSRAAAKRVKHALNFSALAVACGAFALVTILTLSYRRRIKSTHGLDPAPTLNPAAANPYVAAPAGTGKLPNYEAAGDPTGAAISQTGPTATAAPIPGGETALGVQERHAPRHASRRETQTTWRSEAMYTEDGFSESYFSLSQMSLWHEAFKRVFDFGGIERFRKKMNLVTAVTPAYKRLHAWSFTFVLQYIVSWAAFCLFFVPFALYQSNLPLKTAFSNHRIEATYFHGPLALPWQYSLPFFWSIIGGSLTILSIGCGVFWPRAAKFLWPDRQSIWSERELLSDAEASKPRVVLKSKPVTLMAQTFKTPQRLWLDAFASRLRPRY